MPQSMLAWALLNPVLSLAFVFMAYNTVYAGIASRDNKRRARLHAAHTRLSKAMPNQATPPFYTRPSWFIKHWPHEWVNALFYIAFGAWVAVRVWDALSMPG